MAKKAKAPQTIVGTPDTEAATAGPSAAPEFNLNPSTLDFTDDAELQSELAKSGGKFFDDPGNVDLEIKAADFHVSKKSGTIYCPGDSTWFNVQMTFIGAGDKEISHWIQVPTTKIKFGKKDTLAVYKKLQQFFFGLGEEVTLNNLGALVQKYFGSSDAMTANLVKQKVNVDLGFEGPYVAKLPESEEYGIYVGDKPVSEDGKPLRMPDRASAITVAKGRGYEPSFVKIVKFTAAKPKAAAKGKGKPAPDAGKDDW